MALLALGMALVARLGPLVAAAVCSAIRALSTTLTFTLRGRRGTWRHRRAVLHCRRGTYGDIDMAFCVPARGSQYDTGLAWWLLAMGHFGLTWQASLCVVGVALGDIDLSLCVAGVALGRFPVDARCRRWLWSRAWRGTLVAAACHSAWQAWHLATSTFTLRGRHGTW